MNGPFLRETRVCEARLLGNAYKGFLVPSDTLLLVCVRVGETLNLTALAAEQTVQVGADFVALTFLQGVALCAPRLEKVGALLGITWNMRC
jgi:hypothetical protein